MLSCEGGRGVEHNDGGPCVKKRVVGLVEVFKGVVAEDRVPDEAAEGWGGELCQLRGSVEVVDVPAVR